MINKTFIIIIFICLIQSFSNNFYAVEPDEVLENQKQELRARNISKNIIAKLKPENRFYLVTNNFTTEASIHTNLFRDLYIVLGDGNLSDGWVVRIYYNPLVIWIWIGSLVIFIGGIVSMNINLRKLRVLYQ